MRACGSPVPTIDGRRPDGATELIDRRAGRRSQSGGGVGAFALFSLLVGGGETDTQLALDSRDAHLHLELQRLAYGSAASRCLPVPGIPMPR